MLIDLHCHSTRSDGALSPAELVARADAKAIELFAITDHDCFASLREGGIKGRAVEAAELSCSVENKTAHVLIYKPASATGDWRALDDVLESQGHARKQRVVDIAEKLRVEGIDLDITELLTVADRPLGRPDIANALFAQGFVRTKQDAYTQYIGDGARCDIPLARFTVGDAVDLARSLNARLAIAHPHTLGKRAAQVYQRYDTTVLSGIEAFYGPYSPVERKPWLALAEQHDLVVTGGSDFHGPGLGGGKRLGIRLPERFVRPLLDWLD